MQEQENKIGEKKPVLDYIIIYLLKGLKLLAIAGIFFILADLWGDNYTLEYQSPIVIESRGDIISPLVEVESEQSYTPKPENYQTWTGTASWYGARPEWCVGCHPDFIMANGQKLDDNKKTLAFNKLPLGTWVVIENTDNGKREEVEITDTGGFESLNRIADMSLALKNALGCGDLCNVKVKTY